MYDTVGMCIDALNTNTHSLNNNYLNQIESMSAKLKMTHNYAVKISELKRKCVIFEVEVVKYELMQKQKFERLLLGAKMKSLRE